MPKGLRLRVLVRILLPFVHLLHERLCFLLVNKGQPGQTFWMFQLEGVEEGAILVVLECVVDFLIPYHTSISGRYVD